MRASEISHLDPNDEALRVSVSLVCRVSHEREELVQSDAHNKTNSGEAREGNKNLSPGSRMQGSR